MDIDKYLQIKLDEYGDDNINRMIDLYEQIPNEKLKKIFSRIHFELNRLFKFLNSKLPYDETIGLTGHYNAAQSRDLIFWIEQISQLKSYLKNSMIDFKVNKDYEAILNSCETFLRESGGSPIPKGFKKVSLIIYEPIFEIGQKVKITRKDFTSTFTLKFIGEGSYAKVFKYFDEFYNRYFVIKRAKDDLSSKEYERFLREYEEMNKLKSPYIVEVFSFNHEKRQYYMEFMDETLYDYIRANNSRLTKNERKKLVNQVFRALEYIHNKGLLHRDISLKNVLLKIYEDTIVVKISDFGLVKIEDSTLSSILSEFKGSLNDPQLKICGFENYKIQHETYALTWLVYFIMTGRSTMQEIEDKKLEAFVIRGLDPNLDRRYQNIGKMRQEFKGI